MKKKKKQPAPRPPPTRRIDQLEEILRVVWKRHVFLRGPDMARIIDRMGRDSVRPHSVPFVRTIRGPYHKRMNLIRFLTVNLLKEAGVRDVADIIHGFGLMEVDPRDDLWALLANRLEADFSELSDYYVTNAAQGYLRLRKAFTPCLHEKMRSYPFRVLPRLTEGDEIDASKLRYEVDFAEYMFWRTQKPPKKRPVRATAWQTESNVSLQYHEREFAPSLLTLTTKRLRRKLFEKTGIFFDTALIECCSHGAIYSTYEEYPSLPWMKARFTSNVAFVNLGFIRRRALRRRDTEDDFSNLHHFSLDVGDALLLFDDCVDIYEQKILSEERPIFADESYMFMFLQSHAAAALGSKPLPGCLEMPRSEVPNIIPNDPNQVDLSGINRVDKVYTLDEDVEFMYEPLSPMNLEDFKREHGQDPSLGPLVLDPRRPPPSGEAVPTEIVDELDEFFVN